MKNNSQKDSLSSRIKVLCSDLRNFRTDFIRVAVAFGLRRAKDIPDEFKPKDKDLPGSVEYRLRISFGANQHKFRLWTDHETYSWTINSTGPDDFIDMLGDIWPESGYCWLVEKTEYIELLNKEADTICELSEPLLKIKEYRSVASKVRAIVRHNGGRWFDRLSVEQSYFEDIEKTIEELGNITVRKPLEIEQKAEGNKIMITTGTNKEIWEAIKNEYDISKWDFGKKINFVSDKFKRKIIFRDVEQAFILASQDFSKPAVILAGGVIEELLRLYLEHKEIPLPSKNFVDYIRVCEKNKLLQTGIGKLSDSAREFRNLVHISREETKRHTISKTIAKGAVSSIFTIASDFQ